jgi:hypothetical protein
MGVMRDNQDQRAKSDTPLNDREMAVYSQAFVLICGRVPAASLSAFVNLETAETYSEREVDLLAPVRAAHAEQQASVELKSRFGFCDRAGDHPSLKEIRGAWFRLLRFARLREHAPRRPQCLFPKDLTHCTWPIRWAIRRSQWSFGITPVGRVNPIATTRARGEIIGGGGAFPAKNTRNLPESGGFKPVQRA